MMPQDTEQLFALVKLLSDSGTPALYAASLLFSILIFGWKFSGVAADWLRGRVVRHSVSEELEGKIKVISNDNHHEIIEALKDVKEAIENSRRENAASFATLIAKLNGHGRS